MGDSDMDTRERILDAALEVLRQRGPAHLSGREVARRAGISFSLINHHFDGREGMMEACLQRLYSELVQMEAEWRGRLDEARPMAAILTDVGVAGFEFARRWQALVRYGLKRVAERGGLAAPWRDGYQDALLGAWAHKISERTGISSVHARLRFHTAISYIARLGIASPADLRSLVGRPDDHEAELDALVHDHIRGLAGFITTAGEAALSSGSG